MHNKKSFTFFLIYVIVCALSFKASAAIVQLNNGSSIEVDEVIKNSPAQAAGIKEQDKLIELNGINIKNLSLKDIASITKKSSKVNLVFIRCLKIEEQR